MRDTPGRTRKSKAATGDRGGEGRDEDTEARSWPGPGDAQPLDF